jgi:hypothetical protein
MNIIVMRTRLFYVMYALPVLFENAFCLKLYSLHVPVLLNYLLVRVSLIICFYCTCGGGIVARMGLLKHHHGHA